MTQDVHLTSGFVPVEGGKLYYEAAGAGHPVVLIHAGIADCRMWDNQFAAFAEHYRVIRYDVRGFGRSDMPTGRYSLLADLKNLLVRLGAASAHLLGASMGGAIAVDFALENPDLVDSLVLVGSGLSGHQPSDETRLMWSEIGEAAEAGDHANAVELELRMWVDGPRRTPDQVDPTVRSRVREMELHNAAIETDAGTPIRLDPPAIGRLGEIGAPTLVLVGDGDQPDILAIADLLVKGIPRARYAAIPRVAHLPSMEEPALFNQIVLDFLKGL